MIKLLRGLGSLIVIGALLVGVPLALVTIAGNPLPSPEQWQAIFTLTPDYAWVITTTKVLPLLCWIAWAAFAGPLLVEIFAGIAGRPTRKRVGVFRGQQRVAASLVAAVAVMLTGFGTIGTTAPAAAADFSQSVSVSTVATAPAQGSATPSVASTTSETAGPVAAESPAPAFVYTTVSHAVVSGDTLWDLAENYYGDGQRYPEIFEANRGVVQSDGRALSDPDLILTGWTLAVPNVQVEQAPPPPAPAPPPSSTDDSSSSDSLDEGTDTGADAGGAGAGSGGGAGGAGAGSQSDSSASETSASTEEASTSNTDVDEADDAESLIPLATAGGAVGLLLAGLLAALGARRLRQRRQRAAGERIAMPEQAAADLELELRLVENPIGTEDIDNALRGLQEWAENTGSVLPELLAVRLADDEIAVYLTQPADLPEPFEPAHPDRTAWVVRPGRATPPTRPTVSPYPALTTIGTDDAGGVLLLDLEQIGSLNVVGDAETARGVLTAIAVELAVNPWSDQIQVTLVGMPHGLAHEIGTFRIQHVAAQATSGGADVWGYQGDGSTSLALGVGVTLVFALFADSGTMTADFTRWAKTPRQAWIATSTAFPVGNLFAMVIGGVIAAATAGTGDLFGIIAGQGGIFPIIAIAFLVINLGSVCTHCLYNGAVGWSTIVGGKMRVLTVILGAVGVVAAALGIWGFFIDWLNLLGVIVPPIGAIIIIDQLVVRRGVSKAAAAFRWQPFAAWAIGSGAALAVNLVAPSWSTVVVGLAVSSLAYLALSMLTRTRSQTPVAASAA